MPGLHIYALPLCLGILMVLINLRGTMDAGRVFAAPTYLFVACFLIVLAIGSYAVIASGGHPQPVASPPAPAPVEALGLWLLDPTAMKPITALAVLALIFAGEASAKDMRLGRVLIMAWGNVRLPGFRGGPRKSGR